MAELQHKRGDTFNFSGEIFLYENGIRVIDLTGWSGTSQVRVATSGDLVENLIFEWLDAVYSRVRIRSAGTALWPVRGVHIDVQLFKGDDVVSSKTQKIQIVGDITRG